MKSEVLQVTPDGSESGESVTRAWVTRTASREVLQPPVAEQGVSAGGGAPTPYPHPQPEMAKCRKGELIFFTLSLSTGQL